MKIEGVFQGMDPVQTGVSKAGNSWQKTYFEIITNEGERSRRVAFSAFGSTVEQVKAVPRGAAVDVRFSPESTDYVDKNGRKRYDTELRCYGLAVITRQSLQPQYVPAQPVQFPQPQGQPMQSIPQNMPTTGPYVPPPGPAQPAKTPQQQTAYTPAANPEQLPPRNMGLPY